MADQQSTEGASTSGGSVSAAESTLEIKIKTLDSQIYSFRVDKNMPVSSFKGKIADQVGVPVGQQRLIFRGKVLKDEHILSEYHVENGDTLHLVERQMTQPQTSSGSGSADASGTDASAGAPRNRIGQISHSVVLGTLNLGDQGEGGAADISRVIGAVLNSLGVGNPTTNGVFGAPNTVAGNPSGPTPQDSGPEQARSGNGSQNHASNQAQFGQPFLNQPFHVPLAGISIPPPSLNTPIPDSLNTLSEFMSRMEGVLSQNASSLPSGTADQSAPELPSNARGLHTPEALGIVLRHAQRFLSGPAVAALSQIAGRIEQEAGSTDASVRSQIQSESVQVGLAMQHIGALLLELGRTTMMLRMGQSPAEAVVNSGHAVYISPSGPNPIMVQPFPHQTSPLFSSPGVSAPNTGTSVPVGIIGGAPRNINIHIHAGSSLSPIVSAVGARAAGGEVTQGEPTATVSGESGATRVLPVRNVIATSVPSRTAAIGVAPVLSTSQPMGNVSTSELPDAAALSTVISQVNSRIRNFLENMRTDNQTPSGQQENPVVPSSAGSCGGATTEAVNSSQSMGSESNAGARELHIGSIPGQQSQEDPTERKENMQSDSSQSNAESLFSLESSSSLGGGELSDKSAGVKQAPLGLGGGLQPKRRSRQMQPANGEAGPSSNFEQSQQAKITGQQILQTLASRSTAGGSNVANLDAGQTHLGLGQPQQGVGQALASSQASAQVSDRQVDVTGMMSQLLESPALNGLLSGVAQQTGVGSPNVLRNMLQQFTQNPAMRNTFNQLAQQVDREEVSNMVSGMGAGEGGTLDFSTMFQQMMPVVSQVLGSGSVRNDQLQNMMPELLPQVDERSLEDNSFGLVSQDNNIQEVVQRIALNSPSQEIFRSMLQSAAENWGTTEGELVDGLSNDQVLIDQFVEMLRNDMQRRLSGN